MKVKDLNGKIYSWNLGQYVGKENNNCSNLHKRTREFLEETFPAIQVLEEVALPGLRLFLDFYLPVKKIAIECQSDLHYKFVPHFHKDKLGFAKSKARDIEKRNWCELNNIELIEFFPDEELDEWMRKLNLKNLSQQS